MLYKLTVILLGLIVTLQLTGCINFNIDNPLPFEDRTWVLEKYGRQDNMQTSIGEREITAKFDSASGKVGGSAGCNNFNSSYQKKGDRLTVSAAISTKMFCPMPGIMQQETQFLNALQGAESSKIRDGKLEIFCSESRLLVFHAK